MSRRRKSRKESQTRNYTPLILLFFILVLGFLTYRYINSALQVLKKDRVNVVVYGKDTAVYSIGINTDGNYLVPFYADLKVEVPGGYGMYRVGAIGKLVSLEKKPDILKKTFSLATSSFIHYYFYAPTQEVYFGANNGKSDVMPNVTDLILFRSNATIGERLALAYLFLKTQPQQFSLLKMDSTEKFYQLYQGYFYFKTYRQEKKEVQILYTENYDSADRISKILQGNGIRVSDVSQSSVNQDHCRVIEQSAQYSQTATAIANFLGCELTHGKTDIYDILVHLSNKEREW